MLSLNVIVVHAIAADVIPVSTLSGPGV